MAGAARRPDQARAAPFCSPSNRALSKSHGGAFWKLRPGCGLLRAGAEEVCGGLREPGCDRLAASAQSAAEEPAVPGAAAPNPTAAFLGAPSRQQRAAPKPAQAQTGLCGQRRGGARKARAGGNDSIGLEANTFSSSPTWSSG